MNTQPAIVYLREMEWSYGNGNGVYLCPCCNRERPGAGSINPYVGHATACQLAWALANLEQRVMFDQRNVNYINPVDELNDTARPNPDYAMPDEWVRIGNEAEMNTRTGLVRFSPRTTTAALPVQRANFRWDEFDVGQVDWRWYHSQAGMVAPKPPKVEEEEIL